METYLGRLIQYSAVLMRNPERNSFQAPAKFRKYCLKCLEWKRLKSLCYKEKLTKSGAHCPVSVYDENVKDCEMKQL